MLETNRLLIRNFVADTHSCFEGWGKIKSLENI